MTVFLLYVSDYETEWVVGVFSTPGKAKEYADKMVSSQFRTRIEEEEVQ